jgi:hypothetical protein
MFRRLVLAGLAMATAGAVTTAQAQQGDKWVLLGTKEVDLKNTSETIDVSKSKGAFKALRIQNTGDSVTLNKAQVKYGDSTTHLEDRSMNLKTGERTRPIDQRAGGKPVDAVVVNWSGEGKGKATLEVWGLPGVSAAETAKADAAAKAEATAKADKAKAEAMAKADAAAAKTKDATKAAAGTAAVAAPASGAIAAAPTTPKAATAAPGTVSTATGGDVLFGSQTVGFGVDRDVIRVGAEVGKFDKIRLRVLDNDIFLNEMKVVYGNGESETLAVAADIKQNTRTKWFNLKGDRFIKEIQLVYRARPNFRGQAHVEVFGEYAEGWLGLAGEGRKFNSGWVMLGAQTADFFKVSSGKAGFDRDVIPVGKNEGGFKKVRVNVRERAITLNELRVVYANGTEDVIPIKTKVEAGAAFGPIDLKNGGKPIKEILAYYRSRIFDVKAVGKGKAVVEVWGQH